jgi:hypothetical protein
MALKSLRDHNHDRMAAWEMLHKKQYNGIACPKCEKELYDEQGVGGGSVTYTSKPPQVAIRCACGYHGFRLA